MHRFPAVAALLGFLLFTTQPATAESLPDELAQAIDALDAAASDEWSYVRTGHDGDELRVERYTGDNAEPWTLVSIDGIPASAKQKTAYAKKAKDRTGRDHPGVVDIRSMIEPGTVIVEESSEAYLIYRFQPAPDGDDDAEVVRALSGTLRLDRSEGVIEWLQMENTEPFSPQVGVKIEHMLMRLEFASPETSRPGFLIALRNDVDARIAGMKSMDQRQQIRFHDFEPVE